MVDPSFAIRASLTLMDGSPGTIAPTSTLPSSKLNAFSTTDTYVSAIQFMASFHDGGPENGNHTHLSDITMEVQMRGSQEAKSKKPIRRPQERECGRLRPFQPTFISLLIS